MSSSQQQAKTKVIVYLNHASKLGYKRAVVRTSDLDVFYIVMHHCAMTLDITTYLDFGTNKNRRFLNMTEIAMCHGPDYCSAMLGVHVFTGDESATGAFKGKGKEMPFKKLLYNPKYQKYFRFV